MTTQTPETPGGPPPAAGGPPPAQPPPPPAPGTPPEPGGAPAEDEGGAYFVIQDAGDPGPWALVRVKPHGLYEMWTGPDSGWVDMPYFAAYFVGGEIGARQIEESEVEGFQSTIKPPPPGAVHMMRGDGEGFPEAPVPEPAPDSGGDEAETPPADEDPEEPEGAEDDDEPEE